MRTAEEILNSKLTYGAGNYDAGQRPNIIAAINEARIEAIKECAEKMDMIYWDGFNKVGKPTNYFMSGADNVQPNRNGLLSLINEVK